LNKYRVISNIKSSGEAWAKFIPDIIIDGKGKISDTIFVFFFIIIYEYFPEAYESIRAFDQKVLAYSQAIYKSYKEEDESQYSRAGTIRFNEEAKQIKLILEKVMESQLCDAIRLWKDEDYQSKTLGLHPDKSHLVKILFFAQFLPQQIESIKQASLRDNQNFIDQFNNSEHKILARFCTFINAYLDGLLEVDGNACLKFSTADLLKLMKTLM